eukprot:Nk52_evm60s1401 gene=Nk52_evmTU60s1401
MIRFLKAGILPLLFTCVSVTTFVTLYEEFKIDIEGMSSGLSRQGHIGMMQAASKNGHGIEGTIDEIFDVGKQLFDPSPTFEEVDKLVSMAKETKCHPHIGSGKNDIHFCAGLDIDEDPDFSMILRAQQSYIPFQDTLNNAHIIGTHNSFASEVNGFGHPGFLRMVRSYKDNRLKGDLKAKLIYEFFFKKSDDCMPTFDWTNYMALVNCSLPPRSVGAILANFHFTKKYKSIHSTEELAKYINENVKGLSAKSVVRKKWLHFIPEKHLQLTGMFKLVFANQAFSMINQLNSGVRLLGIQPVVLPSSKNQEFILCHTSSEFGLKVCDPTMVPMLSALKDLAEWLRNPAHAEEIVILKIIVKGKWQFPDSLKEKLFNDVRSALGDIMLPAPVAYNGNGGDTSYLWPPIGELIKLNTRVIITSIISHPKSGWFRNLFTPPYPQNNMNKLTSGYPKCSGIKNGAWTLWGGEAEIVGNAQNGPVSDGLITASNITMLTKCGIMVSEFDWVSPALLKGAAWSWSSSAKSNYLKAIYRLKLHCPVGNTTCVAAAIKNSADVVPECPVADVKVGYQNWFSLKCTEFKRYACRSKGAPSQWHLSSKRGPWWEGPASCREFGDAFDFYPPPNGFSNVKLHEILQEPVWIGL